MKIFVDQLKLGKVESIDQVLAASFLDVNDRDLSYGPEVHVHGEAYIAEDELVLHLDISAKAQIPCSICNEPVSVPVEIKRLYHVEPLENIRHGIFDITEVVRENVLVETPAFAECHNGHCPQRQALEKYFKKEPSSSEEEEQEGHFPFRHLDGNENK